jgi:hypothetical protein
VFQSTSRRKLTAASSNAAPISEKSLFVLETVAKPGTPDVAALFASTLGVLLSIFNQLGFFEM